MGIFPVEVKSRPHLLVALAITVAGVGWLQRWWPVAPCPFQHYLHLCCPMCGSTRAGYALMEGRWVEALRFNPIFWYWMFWCAVAYLDVWTAAFSNIRPTWGTRWMRATFANGYALAVQLVAILATLLYLNGVFRLACAPVLGL